MTVRSLKTYTLEVGAKIVHKILLNKGAELSNNPSKVLHRWLKLSHEIEVYTEMKDSSYSISFVTADISFNPDTVRDKFWAVRI